MSAWLLVDFFLVTKCVKNQIKNKLANLNMQLHDTCNLLIDTHYVWNGMATSTCETIETCCNEKVSPWFVYLPQFDSQVIFTIFYPSYY